MSENILMDHQKRIENMINSARVFVFMKGSGEQPACRFSAQVVDLLKKDGTDFSYFNLLEDDAMRQAIKDYTGWSTSPLVFVEGKFIGGADILQEMADNGELKVLLG